MNGRIESLPLANVKIKDGFWSKVQELIIDEVIPYQKKIMEDEVPDIPKSHAIENFRIASGEVEGEFHGMVFQDSDVAKWLEAVAYSLSINPNPELEREADELIDLIGRAQEEDGYLNTYFTVKEPQHKWQNLLECHELYCSGHMIEAAVAYYEATGKDNLLKIMEKNADLISNRYGEGKERGYPGHQEIELALLRLYRISGKESYLETAKYFLDERGKEPEFFRIEADKKDWVHFGMDPDNREYAQFHAPVREQDVAVGHSVRALYMYAAMADLAMEIGDEELILACDKLWENITEKQMYITGGVGSTVHGEAFSIDYELPNDTIYAETCASIAMVFFAQKMLQIRPKGEYADIIEKEIYNGVISGMQLDGKRFFYVNPLEVVPGVSGVLNEYKHVVPERPGWYTCACCPPNVARLMTSLGQYAWGERDDTIYSHIYLGGRAEFKSIEGLVIDTKSNYPWEGDIKYSISLKEEKKFKLAIHIPSWCEDWSLSLNGEKLDVELIDGYVYIDRKWKDGDLVKVELDIKPRRVYANTKVRENAGNVALMYGPLVYSFEEQDNGKDLWALRIPREAELKLDWSEDKDLGKILKISLEGKRMVSSDKLYDSQPPEAKDTLIEALPYYMWANRGLGEMRVWLLEG